MGAGVAVVVSGVVIGAEVEDSAVTGEEAAEDLVVTEAASVVTVEEVLVASAVTGEEVEDSAVTGEEAEDLAATEVEAASVVTVEEEEAVSPATGHHDTKPRDLTPTESPQSVTTHISSSCTLPPIPQLLLLREKQRSVTI